MPSPWLVKVRKVGNSLVVTLPKELEADGYVPGRKVALERLGATHDKRIAVMLLPESSRGA